MTLWTWLTRGDDQIDRLIAANRAKQIDGMEAIDWTLTNRAGDKQWQQVAKAQGQSKRTLRLLSRASND